MARIIDPVEQDHYIRALTALNDAGINFMLGGAFAVCHYSNWWRNTHDLDIYITPDQLEKAKLCIDVAGFKNMGEQMEGDNEWIYHARRDGTVIDLIYRFANLANYIQPDWFDRAPWAKFLGVDVQILPLEELIWMKIFVINRDRCDWPDIMRIIRSQCSNLNWHRLIEVLGDEHCLLLEGLIAVYDWQNPGCMECIPGEIRMYLAKNHKEYLKHPVNVEREHLLDPWLNQRNDEYALWRNE